MDIFIEKIVSKKKSMNDLLFNIGIIVAGIVISFVIFAIPVLQSFALFLFAGIVFGIYYLITSRNVEFEYIVTNGEMDIDRIVARRKRKRMFSGNCREFEIIAKVNSEKFTGEYKNIRKKLQLSGAEDTADLYFLISHYKGERTLVFFEPDQRMLDAFKTYIPRKIFQ
jgi:hypothetical protein